MLKQKIAKLMDLQHFTSTSTNYESVCKLKQETFDLYQEVCADVDGTAALIAELEAEAVRLKAALSNMVEVFDNCQVISGCCMCGEDMARHSSDDHAPCDMGQYYADQYVEVARKLTTDEAMKGGK